MSLGITRPYRADMAGCRHAHRAIGLSRSARVYSFNAASDSSVGRARRPANADSAGLRSSSSQLATRPSRSRLGRCPGRAGPGRRCRANHLVWPDCGTRSCRDFACQRSAYDLRAGAQRGSRGSVCPGRPTDRLYRRWPVPLWRAYVVPTLGATSRSRLPRPHAADPPRTTTTDSGSGLSTD
jgi:hypothetical protein